jgi:hypothetical protein
VQADLQEWIAAVERTKQSEVHVYDEHNQHLATGRAMHDDEFIRPLIISLDGAHKALRRIPAAQRNVAAASQAFFEDHPKPSFIVKRGPKIELI